MSAKSTLVYLGGFLAGMLLAALIEEWETRLHSKILIGYTEQYLKEVCGDC